MNVSIFNAETGDTTTREMTDEEIAEHEALAEELANQPYQIAKSTLWERMSDDEAEDFQAGLLTLSARDQGRWASNMSFMSDSDFVTALRAKLAEMFGDARTSEILAP